jgi:hypothetical protein
MRYIVQYAVRVEYDTYDVYEYHVRRTYDYTVVNHEGIPSTGDAMP